MHKSFDDKRIVILKPKTQIHDDKKRYNSVDQARQHLKDVIQKSKIHQNQARQREFEILKNEILRRDHSKTNHLDTLNEQLYDSLNNSNSTQKNQSTLRKFNGGTCSYKMPQIKVSSNEEVFNNLKKLLVDLKGNTDPTKLMKLKQKRKLQLDLENDQSYSLLPQIVLEEKKKEIQEKEQKQIEKSINQFKTLKDLNESLLKLPFYQARTSNNSPTGTLQYDQVSLQKFYKYKVDLKDKDGFYVNVRTCNDEKLIIYLGEGASFVKINENLAQYIGGLSVKPNTEILEFEITLNQVTWKSIKQPYFKDNSSLDQSYLLKRNGHTCMFYRDKILIFGGEKGKEIGPSLRDLMNDLLILDPATNEIYRQLYDRAALYNRMYHCSFIIDDFLYIFGGQTNGGKPLDELVEIDLKSYQFKKLEIVNPSLIGPITNTQCCPVFYPSRYLGDGRLSYKKISQQVNWSESEHYIKQEGIYMYGGRNNENIANPNIYIMTITFNQQNKPIRQFLQPQCQGQYPPGRYMHSMEFYQEGNFIVIAGGRNDALETSKIILDDIWILKLNSLEWQKVIINQYDPGSKLIIAGGIGKDFKLLKDYQEIELDQSKIKKRFPTVKNQSLIKTINSGVKINLHTQNQSIKFFMSQTKRVTDLNIDLICEKLSLLNQDQLETELASILREPKRYLIHSIVKNVPKDVILDILAQTIQIQFIGNSNLFQLILGGMPVVGDEQKKKSAGGVFLTLLKKSNLISSDSMKKIKNLQKQQSKEKRIALRMIDCLDIDRIKITKELLEQSNQQMKVDSETKQTDICQNQEQKRERLKLE
ncbi:kelch motif family protein [Stylonychia lemnae]|uniref:Kelch motif family protein n=1 Tax=Stylonychia lemnae TaxID=5949 RepID=A0A077ZS31_STYLE|nr:kelch motif family protein [Stylonychia lemnae]|eukprot:CDW72708.1 kelch motif family protein [Stylonychia lemnae]